MLYQFFLSLSPPPLSFSLSFINLELFMSLSSSIDECLSGSVEVIQSGLQNHSIYKSRFLFRGSCGYKALHFRLTLKILIVLLFLRKKKTHES